MAQANLPEEQANTPETGYETSDASLRGVLGFGVVLAVVTIIVQVVLWWMFSYWMHLATPGQPAASASATYPQERFPPEPRLEGLKPASEFGQPPPAAETAPEVYQWADRKAGIARIPIEQAVQILVLTKQLPVRAPAAAGAPPGQAPQQPSPANSGRTYEEHRP
jgi:hypothetical protein